MCGVAGQEPAVKGDVQIMRESKQKKTSRRDEATPETTPDDQRDAQLDQDTTAVLDDIECCLAEVEEENNLAEKRAAKAEWDENIRQVRAREITVEAYKYNREEWVLKYQHLFSFYQDCCGGTFSPDFSELQ